MTNTDLMGVSAFKGIAPTGAFATLNPQAESLADGIGSSYGVVHYRGKNWSLRYRGETYRFSRVDDGTPLPYLDVIILRQMPAKSKSYYPKDSYDEGSTGARPVCASIDGVRPDSDVQQAQAAACAICPRNEWKTSPDGRKGSECSDYKRLAVLILPNLTKAAIGNSLMEPVFLRIPPASLNDLAMLGESMAGQGWHYSSFVTRIGFVPEKAHPQMTFKALQALTEAEAPVVLPMREDPVAYRITGENEVGKERPAPRIATEPPPIKVEVVQPKQAVVIDVEPNRVDTGFGASAAKLAPVTLVQNAEVEESNPDLDARIAGLLKTS